LFSSTIGKDVLAKAKTGTGKTVAFLVLFVIQPHSQIDGLAVTELSVRYSKPLSTLTEFHFFFSFLAASH
jgi:hypothetical protein